MCDLFSCDTSNVTKREILSLKRRSKATAIGQRPIAHTYFTERFVRRSLSRTERAFVHCNTVQLPIHTVPGVVGIALSLA
jgi:hypothetical protein